MSKIIILEVSIIIRTDIPGAFADKRVRPAPIAPPSSLIFAPFVVKVIV